MGDILARLKIGTEAHVYDLLRYTEDCKRNWSIIVEVKKVDDNRDKGKYE